jgi:hypothetical protein
MTALGFCGWRISPRLALARNGTRATRPTIRYRPTIYPNLHRPSNNMKWRDFLSIPKKHRRTRSKARSELDPIEASSEADLAVPRPTESTPDLRIGTSTLPTPDPLISGDQKPSGMRTTAFQTIHLTILPRNIDDDPIRSVPSDVHLSVDPVAAHENKSTWKSTAYSTTKLAINMVKESSDVFPPLKSVVGGLSAILQHCDVRSTSQTTASMMLTVIPANDGVPPDDRIVDASSRRTCGIAQHTGSRG